MNRTYKIYKRIEGIKKQYKNDKSFSQKLADHRLLITVLSLMKRNTSKHKRTVDRLISDYLYNCITEVTATCKSEVNQGSYIANAPIWVCWWQGEENAPPLVQQCIKSIRKNSGAHPVHIISEKNYAEYLEIPEYILSKVNDGSMCLANFSDYLRFSLIEKYGGLWLDATIYVSESIPEKYFQTPFFSCNAEYMEQYISHGRWTPFVVGGWKGSCLFQFVKNGLERYWSTNAVSIDYLLVDYILNLGYENVPQIKTLVDSVPLNNQNRNYLSGIMLRGEPEIAWKVFDDTVFYKLSWRERYPERTGSGEKTVYSAFLEMNLE